jgi:group II intron reverse transcriptase/maturase
MDSTALYSFVAAAKFIGAGLAVSGVIGAGIGIGIIFAGYMLAYARNPYLQNALIRYLFLGFALTEAMGLLGCAVSLFKTMPFNWSIWMQRIYYSFIVKLNSYLDLANKSRNIAWVSKAVHDEVNELDTALLRLSPLYQFLFYIMPDLYKIAFKQNWNSIVNIESCKHLNTEICVLNKNSGSSVNGNVLRWRNLHSSRIIKRLYSMKANRFYEELEFDISKGMSELIQFIENINNDSLNFKGNCIMKFVANPAILSIAAEKVFKSHGVTFGKDPLINKQFFLDLSKELTTGSYKCSPSKRIYILKSNGSLRPLGIPKFKDKIVQESIKMVIEPYYEKKFLSFSFGFRPKRDCKMAVNYIKNYFNGVKWFIEIDISKCFDELNHNIIIETIYHDFNDILLVETLRKILKAGYIFQNKWLNSDEGIPQDSILGPLLCNIYLHKVDLLMREYIDKTFNIGLSRKRKKSSLYIKELKKEKRNPLISVFDPLDKNYRKAFIIRYADDYLLGTISSKKDAYLILNYLIKKLKELKLEINLSKTIIVNSTKGVNYLGYFIKKWNKLKPYRKISLTKKNNKMITYIGKITPGLEIQIPLRKIYDKLVKRKIAKWTLNGTYIRGTANNIIQHDSLENIVNFHRTIWLGIRNYYSIISNLNNLNKIHYIIWCSAALTIAKKLKLVTISKVVKKYGLSLKVSENAYYDLHQKNSKKDLIPILNNLFTVGIEFWIQRYTQRTLKTIKRYNKACVVCGSKIDISFHHVNKISQIKTKDPLKKLTAIMNRRQIAVCKECHLKIHKGLYNRPKL